MGYDNECIVNIQSLPGEYFCPVCRTLIYPNEALQSQCTHLFCKPCLGYIVTSTQACPYDGYLVTEADSKPLVESSKELAETIGKVAVHCLYHRSGCQWQGTLGESTAHGAECSYGNSPVVCNRCGTQIVHRQVQEHAQICPGVQPQGQAPENAAAASQPTAQSQSSAAPNAFVPFSTAASSLTSASSATSVPNAATPALAPVPGAAAPTHEQWYQQQQMQYQQYYQQQHYPGYDPYQQQYAHYQQQYMQPQTQPPPQQPQPFPQPQVPNQPPMQPQQPYMPPQQYPQPQARPLPQQMPPQQMLRPQQPMQMQPQPQSQMQPSPAHAVTGYQSYPQPLPGPPQHLMHMPQNQFPSQHPPQHPPPHSQMPMPGPQQPGMANQLGYQQPAMQPHGYPQQAVRPQGPTYQQPPMNAPPPQGLPPYQQPQARPMMPTQGMPQQPGRAASGPTQQPQLPLSASPAKQGVSYSDKVQSGKKFLEPKAESDEVENKAKEKDGQADNDGKSVSDVDKPEKLEEGSSMDKDKSDPVSNIPNQGQVANSMHPPTQQNAFPAQGQVYQAGPHQQYPPGVPAGLPPSNQERFPPGPPEHAPYGHPHMPDTRHPAPYQPPNQMPVQGQTMPPNQMRLPAPQESFWPPPHAGIPNQSLPPPPPGGVPSHHGFPPPPGQGQSQVPLPPHARPVMGGPPPGALDARGPPFIPEGPLVKINGMANNAPEDRFRHFVPEEGFNAGHDEHFRPPRRDFNEDLKQFPRPAHLDAECPPKFDGYMSSSRPGVGNALTPMPFPPDSLNHAPEFGRRGDGLPPFRSPGHFSGDIPGGIRRGPDGFGSPNLSRVGNLGGHRGPHDTGEHGMPGNMPGNMPPHMLMGDPGFNERFGLVPREGDLDTFDQSRKRNAGSTVRCLICKIDCETVEGLELHSQTREHQNMAMEMVMNIKKENAKKHKPSANPFEDTNKPRKQGFDKRGDRQ